MEGLHHQLVFYASVAPLVAFYVFFAAVLYPASAHLHPHGFYAAAAPLVPIGLRGLLKVLKVQPELQSARGDLSRQVIILQERSIMDGTCRDDTRRNTCMHVTSARWR